MSGAEVIDFPDRGKPPLPHNVDLEQSMLGAILINNDAFYRVSDFLEPKHFFEELHQLIFEVCAGLIRAGRIASPITMKDFIPVTGIPNMTGPQYLARLAAEATTVINALDYGTAIRELADRRELLAIADDLTARAMNQAEGLQVAEIVEKTEETLHVLGSRDAAHGGFVRFSDALKGSIDMAAKAYQHEGHLSGTPTGLIDLDHLMGGMQRTDLIVLAGRTSQGKTALATTIAHHVSSEYRGRALPDGTIETVAGGIVGFFSLEMSAEQLATRINSAACEIPSSRIRRGDISEADFTKLAAGAQVLQSIPLYIEERGGLSIAQIVSRARRLKRQRGLDLLVVDYIQLLTGTQRQGWNRTNEVTEITTKLKALAKELDIPILALSQLSRQVEARENKRPQLSDLRESGSIEQDADVVLLIFREEYYLKGREPKPGSDEWFKWEAALKAAENKAEIIVAKHRHGPGGSVTLGFEPQFTRFYSLALEHRLPLR